MGIPPGQITAVKISIGNTMIRTFWSLCFGLWYGVFVQFTNFCLKSKLCQRDHFAQNTSSYLFRLFGRFTVPFLVLLVSDTLLSYGLLDLSKCRIPLVFSFLQGFLLGLNNLEELSFCFADQIFSLFFFGLFMCFLSKLHSREKKLRLLATAKVSERFLFAFRNSVHAYEAWIMPLKCMGIMILLPVLRTLWSFFQPHLTMPCLQNLFSFCLPFKHLGEKFNNKRSILYI